jgi:hypothetical protein
MNEKPPLRLIRNAEADKDPLLTDTPPTTTPSADPPRERVAGKRLLAFLSSYADSIDNDIKNIMDL